MSSHIPAFVLRNRAACKTKGRLDTLREARTLYLSGCAARLAQARLPYVSIVMRTLETLFGPCCPSTGLPPTAYLLNCHHLSAGSFTAAFRDAIDEDSAGQPLSTGAWSCCDPQLGPTRQIARSIVCQMRTQVDSIMARRSDVVGESCGGGCSIVLTARALVSTTSWARSLVR